MRYIRAIIYKIKYFFIILIKSIYSFAFKVHVLNSKEAAILNQLEENGYYLGTKDDLKEMKINSEWTGKSKLIRDLLDKEHDGTHLNLNKKGSINIMLNQIPNNLMQSLYSFALSESFIKIIENYLKLNLSFRGVAIKKDLVDGREIETRKWHIDGEDNRIIKIIFYLKNVDENGGPFTCISKKFTINNKIKKDSDGRIDNQIINNRFSQDQIIKFLGDIENFIMVDTCSVLHKGELPIKDNRYIIFFCYNSQIPTQPKFCKNLNPWFVGKFKGIFQNKITAKI